MRRMWYRTKDGRADYRFEFRRLNNGTWRIYILQQPSYGSRNTGSVPTHRLSDGGRKYICWTTPIRTLEAAKKIAAKWSDHTQEYIRTGKRF